MAKNRLLAAATKPVASLSIPFLSTAALALGWVADAGSERLPTNMLKDGAKGTSAWSMGEHARMDNWLKVNGKWVIGLSVGLIVVVVFGFFYNWIWNNTTNEPWTDIMRRRWWYLIVPAIVSLSTTTYLVQATSDDVLPPHVLRSPVAAQLRKAVVWRMIFLVVLTMVIGVLCGHVFWGTSMP